MGLITIDLRSRKLIYEQIVDNVKEQVVREVLKENDYLPSVRSLANELGINPNTIQKAYAELERQGIIHSVAGRGCIVVVTADTVRGMLHGKIGAKVAELAEEARTSGMTYEEFCAAAKAAFEE